MKRKKLAAAGLTAALTLGMGISVWAAGWVQNNGQWQYQDNYGYIVKNQWQTGADGKWRYLNSSGYIATDTWIDDEYYVNTEGIMLADSWLKVNGNPNSDQLSVSWYFFDSKGKAVKDGWKKINDKYYFFDDMGIMLVGWVDENRYYVDEGGGMLVGWQRLDPPSGTDYSADMEDDYDPFSLAENDGQYWYYFNASGKKATPKEDGGENGVIRIDGDYYCMNMDGALQFGWKNVTGENSITGYKYFLPNGKMVTGWYTAEPPRGLDDQDDEVHWYYFNSRGVPKASEDDVFTVKDLTNINGKVYLFNSKGNPVYGLRKVYLNDGGEGEYTSYYFGKNENECWVHKGRQQVEEDNGESTVFYFADSGRGYTGVKDNYLYFVGKIQKAESDKYEVFNLPGKDYGVVVNSSGKVMKNTTVKMSDGSKYKTDAVGKVIKINDENVSNIKGTDPKEPEWHSDDSYF